MTAPVELNEKQFTAQIKELAEMLGWAFYHPWLSIHSPRGWPDVALCKPPRLVLAELKSERGTMKPDQQRWIDLLSDCPGVEVFVWKPHDLDDIAKVLRP